MVRVHLTSTRSRVLAVNLVLLLALSVLLFANNVYIRRHTLAAAESRLEEDLVYVQHWFDSNVAAVKNSLYRVRSSDEVILAAVSTRQDHTYFERVRRIMDRLRLISTDVPFVSEIHVYLTNHDRVISHDGTRDYDVYLQTRLQTSRSVIARSAANDMPHGGTLIYAPKNVIIAVPMPRHGAVVAELDADDIVAHMRALNSVPGTVLMIRHGDVPLYWAMPAERSVHAPVSFESAGPLGLPPERSVRSISRTSADTGLTFLAVYDPGLLLSRLRDANIYTVLAFALIFGFNVIAAVYYRRIFAPLEGLMERIGSPAQADDDLRFLSREFIRMQRSNERLLQELGTHQRMQLEVLLSRSVTEGRPVDLARAIPGDTPLESTERVCFVFSFTVPGLIESESTRIAQFEQHLEATYWSARLPVRSGVHSYMVVEAFRRTDTGIVEALGRLAIATVGWCYMGTSTRVTIAAPVDLRQLCAQSISAIERLPARSSGAPPVSVYDPRANRAAVRGMTLVDERMLVDAFTAGDVDAVAHRIALITDPSVLTVGELRSLVARLLILLRVIVRSRGGDAGEIGIPEVDFEGYRLHEQTERLLELYRIAAARCAAQDRSLLTKITEYVTKNYAAGIGASEVARALGMTPGYISSYYHRHTGHRLVHYIHEVCIQHAAELIRRKPDTPVAEVARAVGMPNPNTFIRNFKRLHGCTPGEYRRDALCG